SAAPARAPPAGPAPPRPAPAGRGTPAPTPPAAPAALSGAAAQALMNLVAARPELGPAVAHAAPPAGGGGIDDVESYFAAYLDAEKQAGRIAAGTDTQALAFILIGAIHHLVITSPGGVPDLAQRVRRIVAALLAGAGPGPRYPAEMTITACWARSAPRARLHPRGPVRARAARATPDDPQGRDRMRPRTSPKLMISPPWPGAVAPITTSSPSSRKARWLPSPSAIGSVPLRVSSSRQPSWSRAGPLTGPEACTSPVRPPAPPQVRCASSCAGVQYM